MQNIILLVVFAFSYVTSDRVYTSECPVVVPMPDFNMKKFLGVWYQVQPNIESENQKEPETLPSCEFYNITSSGQRNLYTVNEILELYTDFEGNTPLQYESVSTKYLNVIDRNVPAIMRFIPTMGDNIIESNFTVFATDYESYAIMSSCHKEISDDGIEFTQHTTLWSRIRNLNDSFIEKLYDSIGLIDFDPYDLYTIEKTGCIEGGKRLARVNLDNGEIVPI